MFFDTETSGLDFINNKIIELAMFTVIDGEVVDRYDEFINIGEPLAPKIMEITGITNERLRNEGIDERNAACDLKKKLTAGTVMVAHNCQFDLMFIYFLLKRYFPSEADDIVSNLYWIDSMTVLKDRKNYPHKLIDAVNHYNLEKVNFHRAIDDTKALYYVTLAMKEERDDLKEYINIFGYNPKYGVTGYRFPFIEYKSQPYHNCGLVNPERILPRKNLNHWVR
ncbi:MAG: 3'-5' exonuclease [Methanobrevibacter sp.]|nr:3'-5' exonuclease [Methanobrevibacter sp.]MDO5860027.1 3'-5' exonuclease [Methanobrevibacter sp.]